MDIGKMLDDDLNRVEKESWEEREENFLRVGWQKGKWGMNRDVKIADSKYGAEFTPQIRKEDALKNFDKVWEVKIITKRIK